MSVQFDPYKTSIYPTTLLLYLAIALACMQEKEEESTSEVFYWFEKKKKKVIRCQVQFVTDINYS